MKGIPNKLPPVAYLHACFRYEQKTGKLFWRKRPMRHFLRDCGWNPKYAGKEAFKLNSKGYRQGELDAKPYQAHRVIWKMVTGKEPPIQIDHKDHDRANNRWNNLRGATNPQNSFRKKKPKGRFNGIHRHNGFWRARAGSRKNRVDVGLFRSREAARAALQVVHKQLYGEFAK